MFAPEVHSLTDSQKFLIASGKMNPDFHRVKTKPIIESPVRQLTRRFMPTDIANALYAYGFRTKKNTHATRRYLHAHFKDFLGTLPKHVLEDLYIYLTKVSANHARTKARN